MEVYQTTKATSPPKPKFVDKVTDVILNGFPPFFLRSDADGEPKLNHTVCRTKNPMVA